MIVRLFKQSYEQKGVLTNADAATIMRLSLPAISKYIREYEKETGRIIPRKRIAYTTGLSKSLTREYVEMINGEEMPF